jgi:hypothetical protein
MNGEDLPDVLRVDDEPRIVDGLALHPRRDYHVTTDNGATFLGYVRAHIGTLLLPKGFEVTETFLERMRNFGPGILQEGVRVLAAAQTGALVCRKRCFTHDK